VTSTIRQFHYTSCIHSLDSSSGGFKLRTWSEGVDVNNVMGRMKFLNYRVPSSADYKDKSKKGPTNFTTCEFDEQDILIARVSDTQKDYTGRYGNYLIHGLLIPKNQLLFAPTHGMNWKGWKTNLLPEDDQKTPKHLPKLSIDEITNGIPVTDLRRKGANLALDWAKKDPARADGIASAIAYLAVTNDKNGQIVIQDTVDEAFNWAHTFLSLLPYPCYSSFDWSTYAYSPVYDIVS